MPYPNEHSLRIQDPDKFDSYGRSKGGKLFGGALVVPDTIGVIWGHPKGGPKVAAIPQALRFPIDNWTEAEAKKWIKDNEEHGAKGSFEPAKKKEESLADKIARVRALAEGGSGSGNFGHAGRPGEQGGSGAGGGGSAKGSEAERVHKNLAALAGHNKEIRDIRAQIKALKAVRDQKAGAKTVKVGAPKFSKPRKTGRFHVGAFFAGGRKYGESAQSESTTAAAISLHIFPPGVKIRKSKRMQKRHLKGTDMVIELTEQFFSLQQALMRAIQDRFGPSAWVSDFSDEEVIFQVQLTTPAAPNNKSDEYQLLSYYIQDYAIVLGDEEPEPVVRQNVYEPITAEEMVRMADAQHCLRVEELAWQVHATHDKKEPKKFTVRAKHPKEAWAKAKAACSSSGHKVSSVKAESIGFIYEGGAGSGNFGHVGRPGEIGGSGGGGAAHVQFLSHPVLQGYIKTGIEKEILSVGKHSNEAKKIAREEQNQTIIRKGIAEPKWRSHKDTADALIGEVYNFGIETVARALGYEGKISREANMHYGMSYYDDSRKAADWLLKQLGGTEAVKSAATRYKGKSEMTFADKVARVRAMVEGGETK